MKKMCIRAAITIVIALSSLLTLGCEDHGDADTPINFVVYGTIVKHGTGEPLRAAEVSLYTGPYNPYGGIGSSQPIGSIGSAVTGMDGQYEMHCVVTENILYANNYLFTLYIYADGYDSTREITLTPYEGMKVQQDVSF